MCKAVVFDVDGTLVDSVDLHARAWQDAFRDYGHKIPFSEIRRQIGKGGDQLLPVFLKKEEIEKKGEELVEHRSQIFKQCYLSQVKAFPKVRDLFERLRVDGKRIALASSAKQDELQVYKHVAEVDDLVDVETSADDAERSKPHPDIFQAAIQRLRLDVTELVVIGDTPYDVEAAQKAGLGSVGFLCGGWPEADLRRAGCIAVYQNPEDLLNRYDHSLLAGSLAKRP